MFTLSVSFSLRLDSIPLRMTLRAAYTVAGDVCSSTFVLSERLLFSDVAETLIKHRFGPFQPRQQHEAFPEVSTL